MEKDDMIIRCLHCGTKNRIPREHLNDRPTCGKCHAPLDEMIIRFSSAVQKTGCRKTGFMNAALRKMWRPSGCRRQHRQTVDVTDASFAREVLQAAVTVLVDCWAPWCAPCRQVAPILDTLAAKYAGGVCIAKLNIDENPLTASQYDIRNIPTMLLFAMAY
jgi:thioredoxin 2